MNEIPQARELTLEERIEIYRNLPYPETAQPVRKMSQDETNALAEDFGDYSHYFD